MNAKVYTWMIDMDDDDNITATIIPDALIEELDESGFEGEIEEATIAEMDAYLAKARAGRTSFVEEYEWYRDEGRG